MTDPEMRARDALTASLSGRYSIERELGSGGMATVYLAHDERHGRRVALKVMRAELAAVIGSARFLQEIRTVANLQHPHILPLFDSGEVDGTVFYVMLYTEGESLRDRLERERQLPVDDAVRIACEVASALDHAHRRGVLHRDIKPENILLQDNTALVADFGIALAVARSEGGTRLTETGMSLGTPHYMSPEQAMGERALDGRTDVYSLGCVTYEMLAGEPPFTGPSAQAIIARVVTEEPRPLSVQRRTIPAHVEATVHRALEKLPADRFGGAAQFADSLTTPGLTPMPAVGVRFATAGVTRPPSRARQLLPWAMAVIALVLAVFAWLRPQGPGPVTRQRIALWQHQTEPGTLGHSLAISPDGALVVYVDTIGGSQQLWVKSRDRAEVAPLAGSTGATGPVFSPDGSSIAFIADGRLKRIPAAGGAAVTLADSANVNYPAIAWTDDNTLLFNDASFNLVGVSEHGGPSRRIFTSNPRTRGVSTATALPGSRGAIVATCTFGCPDVDLRVIDLRTGGSTVLAPDMVKGWYVPGDRIVMVRRDGAVFVAGFDLGKMEMRGSPVPVMEGVRTGVGEPDMALSPSGTMIYAAGSGDTRGLLFQPVWVTRSGDAAPLDPDWAFTPAGNGGVAVSPDGRRLAVSARASGSEDVWIKDLSGGPVTRITFGGFNIRPEWSLDGQTVFYISSLAEGAAVIRTRRADGSGAEETVLHLNRAVFEIARTPDPAQFIVRLGSPPSRDILLWRRGAGADSLRRLIASPDYDEIAPALSPDGRWLAYVSNESGRNEVYVRPFPDVDAGRWQLSRAGGVEPAWARNGRELFYRDASGYLISVPVHPGSAFATGEPRVLFSSRPFRSGMSRHESYDVTADGRFIFTRQLTPVAATSYTPLIQVENWFTALREAERRR